MKSDKEELIRLADKEEKFYDVLSYEDDKFKIFSKCVNLNKEVLEIFNNVRSDRNILEDFKNLFSGEKVNGSEEKSVGHHKYRSTSFKKIIDLASKIKRKLKQRNFKNIVIIGTGGSIEGNRVLYDSFYGNSKKEFIFRFISGSDKKEFEEATESLNKEETCFFVVSKSFKTAEVLFNLDLAKKWVPETHMKSFWGITSSKEDAISNDLLSNQIFSFPDDIGGRYSIWSEVCLPLLIELDSSFVDFFKGGGLVDELVLKEKRFLKFLIKLSIIDLWNSNFLGKDNKVILSYSWKLRNIPNYIQQLEMESLGKPPNSESIFEKTGQTLYGGYGPKAQHSIFQLLNQGTSQTCADLIYISESDNLNLAQVNSSFNLFTDNENEKDDILSVNSNIPSTIFEIKTLDPFSLGMLLTIFEHKVFISSRFLKINPFDQFGVEKGKKKTMELLESFDSS